MALELDTDLPPDDEQPLDGYDDAGIAGLESPIDFDDEEPAPGPLAGYGPAGTAEQFAAWIMEQEQSWERVVLDTGLASVWRIANAAMFSQNPDVPGTFDTIQIGSEGPDGQQLRYRIDEPASLMRQLVTMATGQRAAFQAVALNTDAPALAMAPAVDTALDYFYRREMPDSAEREAVENALGYGAAYAWERWDKWQGDDVKVGVKQVQLPPEKLAEQGLPPDTEAFAPLDVYGPSGLPVVQVLAPWEEFHNPRKRGRHLWRGVKERRSKHELAATYPEIAEKLLALESEQSEVEMLIFGTTVSYDNDGDDVVVRHVYHVPIGDPNDESNPLQKGRYFAMAGTIPLPGLDGPLPVTRKSGLPVIEMMPHRFRNIAFGHSPFWGVLACQQGNDAVISDCLSNVAQFGRTSAFKGEETDMDLDKLASGGGVFTLGANEQAPGFMQPPPMSPIANFLIGYNDGKKVSLVGLNDVARGQPGANITSGEMAALFTNLAIEFNSDTQLALDEFRRAIANVMADLIMLNAEHDLLVQVTGQDSSPYLKVFRAEMFKGIRMIEMQTVPPLMRSTAGRMQIWQVLEKVKPEERAEVLMLLTTGQWKQMGQTDSAAYIHIKWQNEQLAKGVACESSAIDDPYKHVPQHVKLYNELAQNPDANKDGIAAVLKHIQEDLAAYYITDPMLAAMLKFAPPPQPQSPAPPPKTDAKPHADAAGDAEVPAKADEHAPALPNGKGSAQVPDRLGSKVPNAATPPAGAQV